MTRFADVPSACPVPSLRTAARTDVYYTGVWSGASSQAVWLNSDGARAQAADGLGRLPAHLDIDPDEAWASVEKVGDQRLDALAVAANYHTVTSEQMAAITGQPALMSARSRTMAELFATGITEVGVLGNGMLGRTVRDRLTLHRPARNRHFHDRLQEHLTYPELMSITAGKEFAPGLPHDRHDLLAAEFLLRCAEWVECGVVLGERLSDWDLLAFSGTGAPSRYGMDSKRADGVLVRTDGLRVAIEVTATVGPSFKAKVRRWAALLSERSTAQTGLVVLFLVAPSPGSRSREHLNSARKHIAAAARDHAGWSHDRTHSRMFVADFRDYFPAPGQVAPGFFPLMALRPTGPVTALWEEASVLDPMDTPFDPHANLDALAVLSNSCALRSVPFWLRTGKPPALWTIPIKRAGYLSIPVPAPSRESRYSGAPLAAARGAAGQGRPPLRLRSELPR